MSDSNIAVLQSNNAGSIWDSLVEWVQTHEGLVHTAICLRGEGPTRRVVATESISKGELLIRIPPSCVLSGATKTASASCNRDEKVTHISPWLKCVAAYYEASTNEEVWGAYFDSLPTKNQYETLFHWTDEEIQKYLAGTTLGTMVQSDRQDNSMRNRYRLAVRPHLRKLGLVTKASEEITDEEFDTFLQACMCISTRGFHLTKDRDENVETLKNTNAEEYQGPFLLPVIDLLNHDPRKKCTTLQLDAETGVFFMTAERTIIKDEEMLHSYGESLTSAQLLQTFGFVTVDCESINETIDTETDGRVLTPASFQKIEHVLAACQATKESTYPKKLQEWMKSENMEEDEFWDVHNIPTRGMEEDISEDLLVTDANGGLLSNELITLLCLQFLPQTAYEEICPNGQIAAWLDRSILEDYYLGKLVCHSLQEAIRNKINDYTPFQIHNSNSEDSYDSGLERDKRTIKMSLLRQESRYDQTKNRALYGLAIRIEEMTSLRSLRKEVLEIMEWLDQGESMGVISPPTKRHRVE